MQDIYIAAVSALFGAAFGGMGAALGVTVGMKMRLTRVEQKVGITEEGQLTGNGLLNEVKEISNIVYPSTTYRRPTHG